MDVKSAAGEDLEGRWTVIGSWRTRHPCYMGAESLAELCLAVMWKAELVNDGIAQAEISKESVEGVTWFCFFSFTGSQIEKNCAPGWIIPRGSPLPYLDDLDGEIWDF